jgi:hypothetical protein
VPLRFFSTSARPRILHVFSRCPESPAAMVVDMITLTLPFLFDAAAEAAS